MRNGLPLPFGVPEPDGWVGSIIDGVRLEWWDADLFLSQLDLHGLRYGTWYTAAETAWRLSVSEETVLTCMWECGLFPRATYWEGQWWFPLEDVQRVFRYRWPPIIVVEEEEVTPWGTQEAVCYTPYQAELENGLEAEEDVYEPVPLSWQEMGSYPWEQA